MNSLKVTKGFSNEYINFDDDLNINLTGENTLFLNLVDSSQNININIEKNSVVKLYLTYEYTNSDVVYNIDVKDFSDFEMVCFQKLDNHNIFNTDISNSAKFNMYYIDLSSNSSNEFHTNLLEEYADFDLKTACVNLENTKSRFKINTQHLNKVTSSNATSRSVILDGGEYKNNTVGFIKKGCSLSKCFQDTKAIVLGKNATALCDPVLLIDEYDVEASHACAVGQINEDELYYMQSRGLSYKQCLALLINGFLISVTEGISDIEFKEMLVDEIHSILSV